MAAKCKAVAVDGIEISLRAEDLDDFEIVEAIADANDPDADEESQMRAVVRIFRLVYKSDYARIKKELREKNGGRLTAETMMAFFNSTMEAIQAKN